jgi:hypothetical protein
MKIYLNYYALILFLIIHITIADSLLKTKTNINLKSIRTLKGKIDKREIKTESNIIQKQLQNKQIRLGDFFKKESKKNQGTAAKALSAFVLGIVLFFGSIYFICWNERRAVKDTEFIDYLRHPKKCFYINGDDSYQPIPENENKVAIITGQVSIKSEAEISNLPLNIKSDRGKIAIIKTEFEKFSKTITSDDEEVGKDAEGNTLMKREEVIVRNWSYTDYTNNRFTGNYYYGEVIISNKYFFPMRNLESFVDRYQTPILADNKYIYFPIKDDISILEEYFKVENNNNKPFKILVKDQYIYILRSSPTEVDSNTFNPDTYDFSDSDIRMCIKYYYISTDNSNYFTVAGKLSNKNEKDQMVVTPYITDLNRAGCSLFCCCCSDDDSKYEVNLIYDKKMTKDEIVKNLEDQNDTCTCLTRVLGFLMQFLSIYLILYPLILLIGMIPFLGAIGATILIFFAFLLSLMTFLFIIACAWICARPIYSVILFGLIFLLIIVGKTSKEQFDNFNDNDKNNNGNYNTNNKNTQAKRSFLQNI